MKRPWNGLPAWLRSTAVMLFFLGAAIGVCFALRQIDHGDSHVSLIFVLAVALISRLTDGYFYGICGALFSVVCVNYVFTYPYWAFNFTMTGYPLTFLTMLTVSVMVSAMTTQIKRQEREYLETERESMRANLLRAMSHDIRTPLTSIVGNTAAVLENEDALLPAQRRKLLRDANEDAQWLIRMVESLLSVTRISGEPVALHKEYEAAEEIVASAVEKFEKRFGHRADIAVEVPEELLMVPMDATLIQQVLLNLLENAVLHGETTTQILLGVYREGDSARFVVSDDGCGIAPERLPTIFEGGLSSAPHGNFDAKKNMGIGLSVCRTIIKAHGGTIAAGNRAEGGASFWFYLPIKEEKNDENQG